MKCILILGDGMADEPVLQLGGKTPLEYAQTPHMDRMAREGACGILRTIPDGFEAGSDIANMSILGYAPAQYYTGRGPLEAMSMGIDLAPTDVAYRCNIVTVIDGIMADFSAGHISSAEGEALLTSLAPAIRGIIVKAGVSYRNLLVVPRGSAADSTAPHDIVGQPITEYLPRNGDADLLLSCMKKSREVFSRHPVNMARLKAGKPPATQIWPWSGGRRPAIPLFSQKYNRTGGMISAVDLLNGIARCAGMEVIKVPGVTGYFDTDYMAKARYALEAIKRLDFVYVHIEAPDEAGHLGSVEEKVRAIENVDKVVGVIREAFDGIVAVLPDHPTPIRIKTHSREPVPFVVTGKGTDMCMHFTEKEARKGKFGTQEATGFLSFLFS
jgi:2,3-bisphosphoglycerate-independent phosphoglycerate mutase